MNPNIDIYLRSAFKELDAFAIPEVGTFRKIHRAAEVAVESGELRPPVLEIEFDPQVKESLLLMSYLTNNIHMGRTEADQIVSDISQTILQALKTKRKFEIAEIGSLRRNPDGHLSFHPNHQHRNVFANDYFGLQAVPYASPPHPSKMDADENLIDMTEEHIPKAAPSTSASALKTVTMLGLILMLGITVIYTARKERSTLATGVRIPDSEQLGQPGEFEPVGDPELEETPTLPTEDLMALNEGPSDAEPGTSTESATRGLPATEGDEARASKQRPAPVKVEPADEDLFAALAEDRNATTARSVPPQSASPRGTFRGGEQGETSYTGDLSALDTSRAQQGESRGGKMYYLIMGSFANEGKAKQHLAKLTQSTNYDPIILYPPEGSSRPYRVSIYRSLDRNKVMELRDRLRGQGNNDVWVFAE